MAPSGEASLSGVSLQLATVEAAGMRLLDQVVEAVIAPDRGTTKETVNEDGPEIRATLGGDGEAYARVIRKYQETISAQMWRLCRNRGVCEELTQEVFVEAYLSLRRYRGDAPLIHWLRKIATRVGYRYYKRQAARRAESTIPLQDWNQSDRVANGITASQATDAAEAAAQVHSLLAKLPPRDRLVLTLVYLEDCSIAEAAELIGWSQTMVKVQAHRARKKLKKLCDLAELTKP
jgi:RNA polymerase sigma-70 factor (ECF subfamily)